MLHERAKEAFRQKVADVGSSKSHWCAPKWKKLRTYGWHTSTIYDTRVCSVLFGGMANVHMFLSQEEGVNRVRGVRFRKERN